MARFLKFVASLFLFWLLVFNVHRVVFLAAFATGRNVSFGQCLTSFPHSLPLDLSAAAYFAALPFLLGFASLFVAEHLQRKLQLSIKVFVLFLLVVVCLIQAGDMSVYPEWQIKLPYKAVEHLRHPLEPILTASPRYLWSFIGTFIFELLVGLLLFRLLIRKVLVPMSTQGIAKPSVAFILIGGTIFLFIRGGWGQFPISVSAAFYSDKTILNDASTNSPWQFGADVWAHFDRNDSKLYHYYPDDKAQAVLKSLYQATDSTSTSILNNTQPNVVIILLESWSADVVGSLGEFKGYTPGFDSVASEGLLFTNFYANSWMSEKGNVAVLSGVPSLPTVSIFDRPGVFRQMPTINQSLQKVGYNSSYYYGGYLYFENIKSYLLDHGIQKIVDREDIGKSLPMGQLGVHDGDMMPYFLDELGKQKSPFFSTLFTLSTHSPYDIPGAKSLNGGGEVAPYMESIKYADKSLSAFFKKAKQQPWYTNTLFVLVSDHSHASPHYRQIWEKDRFKIPMLFVGGALKNDYKGKQIKELASQMDIAKTLLTQLDISSNEFSWSRDALAKHTVDFVPISFPSGCGWIFPEGSIAWNVSTGVFFGEIQQQQNYVVSVEAGKCFFQELSRKILMY